MLLHVFVQGRCLGICTADQNEQGAMLRNALGVLLNGGLQPEYWALLGFPAAAAVYAKALANGRAATKSDISPSEQDGNLGQAVREAAGDDSGMIDLGDLQYLLFSAVSLGFVLLTFLSAPQEGFPSVPGLLVGLVGVSAGTYATKKAVETGIGPEITAVQPSTLVIGLNEELIVNGRGFRTDTNEEDIPHGSDVVTIAGWNPDVGGHWTATRVTVQLPRDDKPWKAAGLWPDKEGLDGERTVDLVVIDDKALRSSTFKINIRRPATL